MKEQTQFYQLEEFIDIEKMVKPINIKENLIHLLQSAVGSNSFEAYKKYAEGIYNLPPIHLRDLIGFRNRNLNPSIEISEVEPVDKYFKKIWKWKYVSWSIIKRSS